MAYSEKAQNRRRCSHVYGAGHAREGERCRAFAMWDSPGALSGQGLCSAHGGHARGESRRGRRELYYNCRTVPVCRCVAYAWPHRPGGGLCRWPDPPIYRLTTPAGTHAEWRRPEGFRYGWQPTKRRTFRVGPPDEGGGTT